MVSFTSPLPPQGTAGLWDLFHELRTAAEAAPARATHTGTQTSATISDFTEAVQDAVAALLGAGSNVVVNYDDAANSLTISTTGSGGTGMDPEQVRDVIGIAIVGLGPVAVTVNDAADTITISTTATVNATDAALRDRASHTGAQAMSTVTGLPQALSGIRAVPEGATPGQVMLATSATAYGWANLPTTELSFSEYWRTSDCSTFPGFFTEPGVGATTVAGAMVAVRARVARGGVFTKMRTAYYAVGTAVTNARMGIYDVDGNLLGATVDYAGALTATGVREAALETAITLADGQEVFLAVGLTTASGTYSVARHSTYNSALINSDKIRSWSSAGSLTGTAPPGPLTGTVRLAALPWIELVR